jgi:hypothetical protein
MLSCHCDDLFYVFKKKKIGSSHIPSKKPRTRLTWKNLLGCPLEALSIVVPENFTNQFGHANAREHTMSLMRAELAVLDFEPISLLPLCLFYSH